jgi:tape measure domain-containing protein
LGDVADSLGSAVLTLSVDDSAYKAGLNAAKAQATSAVDGIAGAFRNLAGIVGVVGLAAFTQQVIAAGQASQQTKLQLEALTAAYGEQRQASESVARIQAVLGISATEARQGYAQLFAALRGTGVGAAQLEVLFVGLTKAAIASGASSAEASAGLLQIKQALASGVLQGDELRSVLENMPALTQALASQLGVSVGELKKLGGEGKITSDIIFEAAKKLAGETVRTKTEAENLGVAFANLKEQIAAAIGPGIIQLFAGIAAGVATVARLIEDNAGKIKGFVVATLALGRALAPFAAAILTVRAAWVAYQVAAKAAAVAQAAVLALTGPKGWAVLAAGLGLAAGAAATIEKTMQGVGAETEKAKGEYEKLKKEFEGVLAGTNLESGSDLLSKNTIKLQKELNIERLKLETTNERIDAAKRLFFVEDGVARSTLESILQIQAAISEARRREREIGDEITTARQDGDERGAAKLVEKQKTAAAETRLSLIQGADALTRAGKQLSDDLKVAKLNLLKLQTGDQGLNQFLNAGDRARREQQAFEALLPKLRDAQELFKSLTGARSAPEFSGRTQDVNRDIIKFIEAVNAENRAVDNVKDLQAAILENIRAQFDLREVMEELNRKNWAVNVNVAADGASQAYGDVINGAVSP